MPHYVAKATTKGSVGDLARITEALEGLGVNILAIGGGEGVTDDGEIGVVSMIVDPEDEPTRENIVNTLQNLQLANGRTLANVEIVPNIHIQLEDTVGQLRRAVGAIGDINIRSILSMGNVTGAAHVGIGVADADHDEAESRLRAEGITVIPHAEGSGA
jgi:hypothetical protein